MADRSALGLIGFVFSVAALAVMTIACLVVRDHVEGRLVLNQSAPSAYATLQQKVSPAAQ